MTAMVVDDYQVDKYRVLILDKDAICKFTSYIIDGEHYKFVPISNMGYNVIAIEANKTMIGKTVEFIYDIV